MNSEIEKYLNRLKPVADCVAEWSRQGEEYLDSSCKSSNCLIIDASVVFVFRNSAFTKILFRNNFSSSD